MRNSTGSLRWDLIGSGCLAYGRQVWPDSRSHAPIRNGAENSKKLCRTFVKTTSPDPVLRLQGTRSIDRCAATHHSLDYRSGSETVGFGCYSILFPTTLAAITRGWRIIPNTTSLETSLTSLVSPIIMPGLSAKKVNCSWLMDAIRTFQVGLIPSNSTTAVRKLRKP